MSSDMDHFTMLAWLMFVGWLIFYSEQTKRDRCPWDARIVAWDVWRMNESISSLRFLFRRVAESPFIIGWPLKSCPPHSWPSTALDRWNVSMWMSSCLRVFHSVSEVFRGGSLFSSGMAFCALADRSFAEMSLCGSHPAFTFFHSVSEEFRDGSLFSSGMAFVRWLTDPLQRCLYVEATLPSRFSIQFLMSSDMDHFTMLAWLMFVGWLIFYSEQTKRDRCPRDARIVAWDGWRMNESILCIFPHLFTTYVLFGR